MGATNPTKRPPPDGGGRTPPAKPNPAGGSRASMEMLHYTRWRCFLGNWGPLILHIPIYGIAYPLNFFLRAA
jgi:hypothetical protein